MNVRTKFEVRIASPVLEIIGYSKTLGSPWIRQRSLFSKIFNGLLFGWTFIIITYCEFTGQIWSPFGLRLPKFGGSQPTQNSNRHYLMNGWSYGVQIWPEHSQGLSEQTPLKSLEKRERGRIQGLPNFWVPPIISRTGKVANSKFGWNIHRSNWTKARERIWRKGSEGASTDCPIFWYPLSQEQVKLRTSNSVCIYS